MNRSLVVSIHDVSPLTQRDAGAILADLKSIGVERTSLLVIPNHHHRGHFLEAPDFCAWLAMQQQAGHEIVVHGYYHRRARKDSDRGWKKLMTRIYTEDEGEFYDLDRETALSLVTKARAEFQQAGFSPNGFIAPAWLLSDAAEEALRGAGFDYTTRLVAVFDLKNSLRHDSQSLVYSVRNRWRRTVSLGWNAYLFLSLRRNPLLRVSIHPPDIHFPVIWSQIREYVRRALEDREAMTYESWIHARRLP